MDSEPTPRPPRRAFRTGAIVAAAVVVGAGAGVGVYARPRAVRATRPRRRPWSGRSRPPSGPRRRTSSSCTRTPPPASSTSSRPARRPPARPTSSATRRAARAAPRAPAGSTTPPATSSPTPTSSTVPARSRSRSRTGRKASATLVGKDDSSDIAVLKVDVPSSELHPLTTGDSASVLPGEAVAAIGSPFGLTETMTSGIVSAIDRTITAPNNYSIAGAIQTDAPINHGNSGGPLLTLDGQVIGVNAQIESDSGGNDGVGFALAINASRASRTRSSPAAPSSTRTSASTSATRPTAARRSAPSSPAHPPRLPGSRPAT